MFEAITTAEVAALTGLDEGAIRKDVEHGIIVGEPYAPRFHEPALIYFTVLKVLGFELGVSDRRRLYEQVQQGLARHESKMVLGTYLHFDLRQAKTDIEHRLERFRMWKRERTTTDKAILGGEPVFAGTRLSVRNVGGMLLRGASRAEVLEDYPYLKDEDLDFAKLYTIAYPRLGRPRDKAPAR